MSQTYRAALPAIGFVQMWFSPAQARFAENTFDVVPSHATVEAAHTLSEEPAESRRLLHEAVMDVTASAPRIN